MKFVKPIVEHLCQSLQKEYIQYNGLISILWFQFRNPIGKDQTEAKTIAAEKYIATINAIMDLPDIHENQQLVLLIQATQAELEAESLIRKRYGESAPKKYDAYLRVFLSTFECMAIKGAYTPDTPKEKVEVKSAPVSKDDNQLNILFDQLRIAMAEQYFLLWIENRKAECLSENGIIKFDKNNFDLNLKLQAAIELSLHALKNLCESQAMVVTHIEAHIQKIKEIEFGTHISLLGYRGKLEAIISKFKGELSLIVKNKSGKDVALEGSSILIFPVAAVRIKRAPSEGSAGKALHFARNRSLTINLNVLPKESFIGNPISSGNQ